MTDQPARLEVTQADRERAAALHLQNVGEPHSPADLFEAEMLRAGDSDDWPEVQAFAAHRLAHTVPGDAGLREAGQFLVDRIAELEWSDDGYVDLCRDWMGHVDPALDRFKSTLSTSPVIDTNGVTIDPKQVTRNGVTVYGAKP